jgi:hypothetical protein
MEEAIVRCHFQTCTCGDIGRLSVQLDIARVSFSPRRKPDCAAPGIRPASGAVNAAGRDALALGEKALLIVGCE